MKTEHSTDCKRCQMYNWEEICPDCVRKEVLDEVEKILKKCKRTHVCGRNCKCYNPKSPDGNCYLVPLEKIKSLHSSQGDTEYRKGNVLKSQTTNSRKGSEDKDGGKTE